MEKKDFRIKLVQNRHFVQSKICDPGGHIKWHNHKAFKSTGYAKIEHARCAVNLYVETVKEAARIESSTEYFYID